MSKTKTQLFYFNIILEILANKLGKKKERRQDGKKEVELY